jgi:predicted ATP-grasp superfamily ATP-dependent carboligase
METAIENRDADYGILVASSLEYLPRTRVGWFSEIDQDYIVVALSEDGEDEIEPRFFKFAYHWARTRTLLSAVDVGDDIDPEAVKNELDGIEDAISKFSNIRTDCKNLEDTAANIRGTLQEIQDDVTERLRRLEAELDQS